MYYGVFPFEIKVDKVKFQGDNNIMEKKFVVNCFQFSSIFIVKMSRLGGKLLEIPHHVVIPLDKFAIKIESYQ